MEHTDNFSIASSSADAADVLTYNGDDTLNGLLKSASLSMQADDIKTLIAGVVAAPAHASDPDSWLTLITPRPTKVLREQLKALHAAALQAAAKDQAQAPLLPERLALFRAELKRQGLDGFVIPRGDEHQGEYLPLCAERLAWITGFTGSAGAAIVLRDKAAIFVDGRYTLQVENEVDTEAFQVCHLIDEPQHQWIANTLKKGAKLGFDPWLHSEYQVARLRNACISVGADLIAVEFNVIDSIWAAQPPRPITPVRPLSPSYAGRSAGDKRRRIAQDIFDAGTDAVILSAPDSIAWLLNIRGGDVGFSPLVLCFAILHRDAIVELFIDGRKLGANARNALGQGVTVREPEALGSALDRLGRRKRRVNVQPDQTPLWIVDRLSGAGARVQRMRDPCALPKALKNKTERAGIRAAHVRDGVALCKLLSWLDARVPRTQPTEIQVAERLEDFRRDDPLFRGPSFPTIAGAGPNGAIVHYRATPETDRPLKKGSLFLLDSGGQYPDGTTDVTRTVSIGRPKKIMRDRFTRVLKGHIAVACAVFPDGTTGAQMDPLARRALWAAGVDYDHGTGHGVGHYLNVHEGPQRISRAAGDVPLEPGMVVSNEPGYYKTGAFGIRIENLVMVERLGKPKGGERPMMGFETLTLAPIDRRLIQTSLLDETEIQWLDRYHRRVLKTISPHLDARTRAWLEKACRLFSS